MTAMDPILTKTLIGSVATVTVAIVTAGFQHAGKLREERRLLRIALVEADTKVAGTFGELIGRSHGRGRSELSDELIRVLLADGILLDTIRQVYSDRIQNATDSSAMVRRVLDDLPITHSIGTDDMDATLRVLAALGHKHDVLTNAARGAVEGRSSWKPISDGPDLAAALRKRENWNRMSRVAKIRHLRQRP